MFHIVNWLQSIPSSSSPPRGSSSGDKRGVPHIPSSPADIGSGSGNLSPRPAAAAGGNSRGLGRSIKQHPMTPDQRSMLLDSVKSNFLFSHLAPDAREAVLDVMERVEVDAGEVIIRQGERGDHFYVAETGTYDILVAIPGQNDADGSKFDQSLTGQRSGQSLTGGQRRGASPRVTAAGSEDEESEGFAPGTQSMQSIARASMSSMGSIGSVAAGAPGLDMLADAASAAAAARLEATWAQQDAEKSGGNVLSGSSLTGSAAGGEGGNSHSLSGFGGGGVGSPLGGFGGDHLGELVHTLAAPAVGVAGAHPLFGELALLYGEQGGGVRGGQVGNCGVLNCEQPGAVVRWRAGGKGKREGGCTLAAPAVGVAGAHPLFGELPLLYGK